VTILQETEWASGPICMNLEKSDPSGFLTPDHPARSQSLY